MTAPLRPLTPWGKSPSRVLLLIALLAALPAAPVAAARPPNDRRANATVVRSLPYDSGEADLSRATIEKGEPRPACATTHTSTWFRILLPADAAVSITLENADVEGEDPATYLALYKVRGSGRLEPMGCVQRFEEDPTISLAAAVDAGTAYLVQAGVMPASPGGTARLTIAEQQPVNDFRSRATVIRSLPFTDRGVDLARATLEGSDVDNDGMLSSCPDAAGTVWYRYMPSADGALSFTASWPDPDMGGPEIQLAAYEVGKGKKPVRELACGTALLGGEARIAFPVRGGHPVLLQAGHSAYGEPGPIDVRVAHQLPANDFRSRAVPVVTGWNLMPSVDLSRATVEPDEPASDCFEPAGTAWYSVEPAVDGTLSLTITPQGDLDGQYLAAAVYRATDDGLEPIACTAEPDDPTAILLDAPVSAGERVLVQVGHDSIGWGGPVSVELAVP